jgi:AcrR family transcriptional regulator
MSSHQKTQGSLRPQRSNGRRRVEAIVLAAGEVFAEKGFAAATMAEIASRADANIGSLYRFFPTKEALADAIIERDLAKAEKAYDEAEEQAGVISTTALADRLIGLMANLHDETLALSALMEGASQEGGRLAQMRAWAVDRIERVLLAHDPHAGKRALVKDIAIVVLNGTKLMAAMTVENSALSSPGAVEELRVMFRGYLSERLKREDSEHGSIQGTDDLPCPAQ